MLLPFIFYDTMFTIFVTISGPVSGDHYREEVRDGKYYTDMTEERLELLLHESGFELLELYASGDSLGDRPELRWINVIGLK